MCQGKQKSFTVSDKIDILAECDPHILMYFDLASELGLLLFVLNTIVKNHEATGRRYIKLLSPGSGNHGGSNCQRIWIPLLLHVSYPNTLPSYYYVHFVTSNPSYRHFCSVQFKLYEGA
jgi:hypothetical protein